MPPHVAKLTEFGCPVSSFLCLKKRRESIKQFIRGEHSKTSIIGIEQPNQQNEMTVFFEVALNCTAVRLCHVQCPLLVSFL
jgi:hypothetical protein